LIKVIVRSDAMGNGLRAAQKNVTANFGNH
jgi:hypothetical protein